MAYDGTDYCGFQAQPDHPTIQGELERALARITREPVRVTGAGRTDAGVHALGQVIHFASDWRHPAGDLQRALNAVLPPAIAVRAVEPVRDDFHARFDARRRQYRYTLFCKAVRAPLFGRLAHQVMEPLDRSAMTAAAQALVGRHDYAAFGQSPSGLGTVRTVFAAVWEPISPPLGLPASGGDAQWLQFVVDADAFLRGMVRRIVGTLLLVGAGRLSVAGFGGILRARDISQAAPPAPACGLCLWRVWYAESGEDGSD